MAWMLQLEDRRILRLDPPAPPAATPGRRGRTPVAAAPAAQPADLTLLIADAEPRIRRRAALAIGRVGLEEGLPALTTALGDADPDVRSTAAFAMGLIGDRAAVTPLTAALSDADARVRGRAAEALGQIGAKEAADAIGKVAAEYARSQPVAALKPDDEGWPAAPEADAFRLAIGALVRLRAYEPFAAAVLDGGRPVSSWWPVAFGFQRIGDPRGQAALAQLLRTPGKYTASFAARGLGAVRDATAVDALVSLVPPNKAPLEVSVSAVAALAQIGDRRAVPPLLALLQDSSAHPNLRLQAVTALGTLRATEALQYIEDMMTDDWPALRIAALRAASAIDQESFILVLSSLDADREWIVRAAVADILAGLPAEMAVERLRAMLTDEDRRVMPSVMRALVRHKVPDALAIVQAQLGEPDFAIRAAAASLIGQIKPETGPALLREAYKAALPDAANDARLAILSAIATYGAPEALETVKSALADKDWAVRLRARDLLGKLEPGAGYNLAIRPAPGTPPGAYEDPQLIAPAYSPRAFVETARGTIEFELAVLDAPQTSRNFMNLARKGFFNGLRIHRVVPNFVVQDGDPRGDGQGGPGYTIRDELNERPFVRGTVGMALSGPDTGGSQFFFMHSPAPHLDADYTVFGTVVNGMDVVDRIQQGDVIQRIRVWDGKGWQ